MIIGFVNAGMVSLTLAAAMIYGANIGTTITAQIVALGRRLGHDLGDDVARPRQRIRYRLDALFGIDVFRGLGFGLPVVALRQNRLRKPLQALFAGNHRTRAALRLVRQIQVLEIGFGRRRLDLRA